MKKLFIILAAVAVTATVSAQNPKIESTADEVVTLWNNDTAPHSNGDTKAEKIVAKKSLTFSTVVNRLTKPIINPQRPARKPSIRPPPKKMPQPAPPMKLPSRNKAVE